MIHPRNRMVYFVVYKASEDYSNRSQIPVRLRALGCRQLNRTFWEFDKEKITEVLKLLEKNQPILVKRVKGVRKRLIQRGRVQDLGSLVVVTFRVPKEKKEIIRNLVEKAPCIRLCRLVYAFYHRQSKFDPEHKLANAHDLATFIKEIGGEVRVIPRIIVLDERLVQRLVDDTRRRMEKRILNIIRKCRQAYDKCSKNEDDYRRLSEISQKLKRQFIRTRRKAGFYNRWIALDLSRDLMKAYKALLKLRDLRELTIKAVT